MPLPEAEAEAAAAVIVVVVVVVVVVMEVVVVQRNSAFLLADVGRYGIASWLHDRHRQLHVLTLVHTSTREPA